MDITEIQRIIRDYYMQQYANKTDNLQKMDKFFEKYNLLRLKQEEIKIWMDQSQVLKLKLWLKNIQQTKGQVAKKLRLSKEDCVYAWMSLQCSEAMVNAI